jgi:hypothetical protein
MIVKPRERFPQKELVELLNKCWMTHDGMWFFHCLKTFGIDATNKINRDAIKSLAPIEIKRFLNALGLSEDPPRDYPAIVRFFKGAAELVIPEFMNVKWDFPGSSTIRWEFVDGQCFAYKGISMMGAIDQYECGVIYRVKCWMDALGIPSVIEPQIRGCIMHSEGSCKGSIRLLFDHMGDKDKNASA